MPVLEEMTKDETAQFEAMRNEAVQPAPEPKPDAAAAQTPEPKDPDEIDAPNGVVPVAVLKSERQKRQDFQKKYEEANANWTKMQGRFEVLERLAQQATQAPQKPADPVQIPDINADPVGHFRALNEQRERELNELRQWRQQQEQQTTVQTNVQRVAQIAGSHEVEFKKANADYDEASGYLRNMEDARLQTLGVADPAARAQIINNRALEIAVTALTSGRNAAETVYALAKASGWQPRAAGAAGKITPEAQRIAMAAAGQQQGGGLGAANGAAPSGAPTLEALAAMSDKEFAEATKGDKWKKLMGG